MNLLAAEITAATGKDPGEHFCELTAEFGQPYYTFGSMPQPPRSKKAKLSKLSPEAVKETIEGRRRHHRQIDARPRAITPPSAA